VAADPVRAAALAAVPAALLELRRQDVEPSLLDQPADPAGRSHDRRRLHRCGVTSTRQAAAVALRELASLAARSAGLMRRLADHWDADPVPAHLAAWPPADLSTELTSGGESANPVRCCANGRLLWPVPCPDHGRPHPTRPFLQPALDKTAEQLEQALTRACRSAVTGSAADCHHVPLCPAEP
jgi:hypothetical protein